MYAWMGKAVARYYQEKTLKLFQNDAKAFLDNLSIWQPCKIFYTLTYFWKNDFHGSSFLCHDNMQMSLTRDSNDGWANDSNGWRANDYTDREENDSSD